MRQAAQSLSVKRAEVELHGFASFGEPERAIAVYAEENRRRAFLIRKHRAFAGALSPFLEIGANAGHTSYLLENQFGADGFALDLSAAALRHGTLLEQRWGLNRAPVRIAGDAGHLPFADSSMRFVMAFQMLSQFQNLDSVFEEVCRVLAPGGVFFFSEEPLKRSLTLGRYRCPYYESMTMWERVAERLGLLGFIVRDVIGADQEESFGIRQNHSLGLDAWRDLIARHFTDFEYDLFVHQRGIAERVVKWVSAPGDRDRPARLLGGTISAFCKKAGTPGNVPARLERFESVLRCPDCASPLRRDAAGTLACAACAFRAPDEGGVYTLLPSAEREELYPGNRGDVIDFSLDGHESKLLSGFHELEGVFGNKYRWIGTHAVARLERVHTVPQRLRVRGHSNGGAFQVTLKANGALLRAFTLERPGLFVLEADVPDAPDYRIEIEAGPAWRAPGDARTLTVSLAMLRLVPRD